jgi:hypothetical protein
MKKRHPILSVFAGLFILIAMPIISNMNSVCLSNFQRLSRGDILLAAFNKRNQPALQSKPFDPRVIVMEKIPYPSLADYEKLYPDCCREPAVDIEPYPVLSWDRMINGAIVTIFLRYNSRWLLANGEISTEIENETNQAITVYACGAAAYY